MVNCVYHLLQFLHSPLRGHLGDKSDNSGHVVYNNAQRIVQVLEPAGGIEHSICRVLFGRSIVELHRLTWYFLHHTTWRVMRRQILTALPVEGQ